MRKIRLSKTSKYVGQDEDCKIQLLDDSNAAVHKMCGLLWLNKVWLSKVRSFLLALIQFQIILD